MNPRTLIVPDASAVTTRPNVALVEAPYSWVRAPAEFVAELSGYDIDVKYLLTPSPRQSAGKYRGSYRDRLLFGFHHLHALIGDDGAFDCQDISGYRMRLQFHIQHHPGRNLPIPQVSAHGDEFTYDLAAVDLSNLDTIPGKALFGTPIEPLNWGMWLLHAIPNAVSFLRRREEERFACYIARPWQRALLLELGLTESQIVHQELATTYQCPDLVMPQYSSIDLAPNPSDRHVFAELGDRLLNENSTPTAEKIFVSRRNMTALSQGRYRALVNENELQAVLEARGFLTVEPELLSFADQVSVFRKAKVVVGLGGAGLFNVIFSGSGTRVISIESSTAFVHGHANLFASLGHRYGFILGRQDLEDETAVHKRWTLDVARAMKAIESFA